MLSIFTSLWNKSSEVSHSSWKSYILLVIKFCYTTWYCPLNWLLSFLNIFLIFFPLVFRLEYFNWFIFRCILMSSPQPTEWTFHFSYYNFQVYIFHLAYICSSCFSKGDPYLYSYFTYLVLQAFKYIYNIYVSVFSSQMQHLYYLGVFSVDCFTSFSMRISLLFPLAYLRTLG